MTFKIHNSHSRKELFDIISVFELPIPNRNEYNKAQIQCKIIDCLNYFDKINPDLDYFFYHYERRIDRLFIGTESP